jgi:hypothetical protein
MTHNEIVRVIRKLSNRRHRAVMHLAELLYYPAMNRVEISRQRGVVSNLDKEIAGFLARLTA